MSERDNTRSHSFLSNITGTSDSNSIEHVPSAYAVWRNGGTLNLNSDAIFWLRKLSTMQTTVQQLMTDDDDRNSRASHFNRSIMTRQQPRPQVHNPEIEETQTRRGINVTSG